MKSQDITKAKVLAQDYKKICSLVRHGKFADVEEFLNQPERSVPIDYQDDMGNTLMHFATQNGNKRMVKLCLRRGSALNLQNLLGQTPLHFAYGYGYAEVGDYLINKGADDTIKNKDGLTCYEGLSSRDLSLL
jgi:ankyrin repeat protein